MKFYIERSQIINSIEESGVWAKMQNTKIYDSKSFLKEFGDMMPSETIELITAKVNRLQKYMDSKIVELKQ